MYCNSPDIFQLIHTTERYLPTLHQIPDKNRIEGSLCSGDIRIRPKLDVPGSMQARDSD